MYYNTLLKMGYPVCTCGRLLADIQIEYDNGVKRINDNDKLTTVEKNIELTKLVNKFHIKRYCCKVRLMTPVNLAETIM